MTRDSGSNGTDQLRVLECTWNLNSPKWLKTILANVRTPEERKGDLNAQVAANNLGIRRICELIDKYGFDEAMFYADESINYAERRMRAEIEKLLDGTYEGVDYLDDDGITDDPIKIAMRIKKEGSDIES